MALNPQTTTMAENNIIQRIKDILNRHETVPQGLKDELILLGLAELLETVNDHSSRLAFLEKYKPYLQALAWAVGFIGAALIMMALTGKLQITVVP